MSQHVDPMALNSKMTIETVNLTASGKIYSSDIRCKRIGNVCCITGWFKTGNNGFSANEVVYSGLPKNLCADWYPTNVYMAKDATEIKANGALAANTAFSFGITYICE